MHFGSNSACNWNISLKTGIALVVIASNFGKLLRRLNIQPLSLLPYLPLVVFVIENLAQKSDTGAPNDGFLLN